MFRPRHFVSISRPRAPGSPARHAFVPVLLLVLALALAPSHALGQTPPLHERIDQYIDAAAIGPIAPVCSDADFVRRIYLDLTGVIPTPTQTREFLADAAPDKRAKLIDTLLADPAFARHMTLTFDVTFMERRRDKTALVKPWLEYLYNSLAADKPLDQLFREMIAADGADEALRPAARFSLNRDAEPNLMTRDIGRLAFGMDLQCAQCHDHPLIDDYYQADYYGLFAFVQRTSVFNDAKNKLLFLAEKADGEANYKSVFTEDSAEGVRPRVPKGAVLHTEPAFEKGQEYVSIPAKDVRGVPKFSRRAALAGMIEGSIEFRRNLANRLWAHMLGRGIVHPVDFHYAANPPQHPELLTLLAEELKTGGFKLRPLLREIALSRAYQRAIDAPRPEGVKIVELPQRLASLEAAKLERTAAIEPLKVATGTIAASRQAAIEQNAGLAAEIAPLETALTAAKAAADKAAAERKAVDDDLAKKREQALALADAAAKAADAVAKLPDDKVLAAAAAILAERNKEFAPMVEAAVALATQRAATHDAAVQQQTAAQQVFDAVAAKRTSAEKLVEMEQAELLANRQTADVRFIVAQIDGQIATVKQLLEYSELAKTDAAKAEAAWAALIERWTISNQIGALKPLTPEQLAASAMQATGTLAAQQASAAAAVDKQPPDALKNAADADKPRIRAAQIELRLIDQVDNIFAEFAKQYGGEQGADFQATATQALYFGNGSQVDAWLNPSGENLAARLAKLEDPAALADELYVSTLSRPATDAERDEVVAFIKDRAADKPIAVREMIWALLSSSEFRFNH